MTAPIPSQEPSAGLALPQEPDVQEQQPSGAVLTGPDAAPAASQPGTGAQMLAALSVLWVSLKAVWKGQTVGALRLGAESKKFWITAFLVYSAVIGLLLATLTARSIDGADQMLGAMTGSLFGVSSRGSLGISFGGWLALFFSGAALALVALVLRSLCIKWTFALRGMSKPLTAAGSILATSYVLPLAVLLGAAVLLLVPSALLSGLVFLIFGVLSVPLILVAEILIYVGINRTASFEKSALIPHAVFTGVWIALTLLAYGILVTAALGSMF